MNHAPILDLLRRRTGLEPDTLGIHAVQLAIAQRLLSLGLEPSAYANRLAADEGEFARLVGEVIVPETWFYRGGDLFPYLAAQIRLATTTRQDPYRVLSLPCSTGEEPYSLAIALAEAGVAAPRCVIDGVDLGARNVEAARRGVYNELAFRQLPTELRRRWFHALPRGSELDASLRARVRFRVGNLHDPGLLTGERPYDLVFCRNLFIYLAPETRRRGLETLARLVAPGGLLALGHTEVIDPEEKRFVRTGPAGYFLYQRAVSTPASLALPVARAVLPIDTQATPLPPPEPPPATVDLAPEPVLAEARRLADEGRYAEALECCAQIQQRSGPSADLYTLLGVVHQAQRDNNEAGRCFNKALYLAPDHREAMLHLMLLCQREGSHVRAAALRAKLARLAPEGGEA